jgi:protocatechuate 3,4-dioxygenase beta subunit
MERGARAQSGRGAVVVLAVALVAAGIVAVLLFGNPFGGSAPDGVTRDAPEASGDGPIAGDAPTRGAGEATSEGSSLRGVHAAGDEGVVRLRVVALKRGPVAGGAVKLAARGGPETTLTTGADGVASFDGVAPGRGWRVEVAVEGFHPVTIQGVLVRPRETTDLGDVVVATNLVLRGRVVNVAGAAVPDAAVEAFAPERSAALDGFVTSMIAQVTTFASPQDRATTDEAGWFTLAALPEGAWRLVVRKAGHATKQEPDVVLSQERPAKSLVVVLLPGASAKGRVTDEAGKAVLGARVVAVRDAGGFRGPTSQTLEREAARTGEDGRYEIDTLAQGASYRFGVMADGYAPVFDAQSTAVQQAIERDFTLAKGGALAGVVKDRATGEPVANATVTALTGRLPFGRGPGGRGSGGGPGGAPAGDDRLAAATATTNEEGRFRFDALLPGPVAMGQVKASGYVPVTASTFPMMGGSWGEVAAGETLEVDVLLDRGGAVEGTLADAGSGAPIVGATVGLVPRDNTFMVFATGASSATTDGTGRFRVEGVKPGRYGIVASAAGYASPAPNDDAASVTVSEDGGVATAALKLSAAGAAAGVVRDLRGELVAGARVRVRAAPERGGGVRGPGPGGFGGGGWRAFLPGAVTSDLTDQEGRFRIENLASGERWVLSAESDDHVAVDSEPFTVGVGETKDVDLVVAGGGAIAGRVVDDQGRFVEGARVRVGALPADQAMRRNLAAWEIDRHLDPRVLFTDADGKFLATKVRPGRAIVRVEKEGFVTFYKRDVEVRAEETVANYVATLSRGEVVEGVVRGEDGRPLEGAMVAVTARRALGPGEEEATDGPAEDTVEPQMSSRSDKDGRFRIENVLPGRTYSVLVYFAPGHLGWMGGGRHESTIRRDVSVPARDVEFRLVAAPAGAAGGFPMGGRGFGGRGGDTVPVPVPPR